MPNHCPHDCVWTCFVRPVFRHDDAMRDVMHGRTASPAHDPSKVKVKRSKRPIPTRSAFIPGRHRCTGRLPYTRMVIEARSFGSTSFVGSLSCGWNRIADALDDYFGVPNINTAAMRTAITFSALRIGNRKHKRRSPHEAGFFICLAKPTGLAYILQAADARARASLRAPPEAAQAASSAPQSRARKRAQPDSTNEKARARRASSFVWRSGRDSNPRPPA